MTACPPEGCGGPVLAATWYSLARVAEPCPGACPAWVGAHSHTCPTAAASEISIGAAHVIVRKMIL